MICPKCGTEFKCPCESCKNQVEPTVKWINMRDDGNDWDQECLFCGFTRGINWFYNKQLNETHDLHKRYLRFKSYIENLEIQVPQ
jgi:hypothetical protein